MAPILHRLFSDIESQNKLPDSTGLGIITLLHKKGDRNQIGNYRPISILNNDYKIFAKMLASRLKQVIGTVVNNNQAYSIQGRDIANTILSIKYVMDKMFESRGIILSLDFNKAFDRVEHLLLWAVLK